MAIFKSKNTNQQGILETKTQRLDTLKKSIEKDYPFWKVLESDEEGYDLILIRNIKKRTTKYIMRNVIDPFHDGKEEIVQLVIVVSMVPQNKIKDIPQNPQESLLSWTYKHLITSEVRTVLRFLDDIEEEGTETK